MCRCGHLNVDHAHYRPGTECATCACTRFRRKARLKPGGVPWTIALLWGIWRDVRSGPR